MTPLVPYSILALALNAGGAVAGPADAPSPTRDFEIREGRAFLGGKPVRLWGLRCGNALYSPTVTERHINNLDNMVAHGINLIGVSIQGCHSGWPDPDAGLDRFRRDGRLRPEVARRLEWLVRAADRRGMVVAVRLFSARKDQDLYDEDAVRRAVEEAGRFLADRGLRNVFVDIIRTSDHAGRIDHAIFREPGGAAKKAKLVGCFKAAAPGIKAGVCSAFRSDTPETFPGMDLLIIQKDMAIPSQGFVVNVETLRQDSYQDDGWFNDGHRAHVLADCEEYRAAPNAAMLFHSARTQGITNFSGTHPEMAGDGTGPTDRGVRFDYEWVRANIGRYDYPEHRKDSR